MDMPTARLGVRGPEKAALVTILARYNSAKNGEIVWPGIQLIANQTGFNIKTVRVAKRRLAELGLI